MKKWIFEMLGAVVAILLFLYVITVFQSCKTPKPVAETISNTEVKHDSTTNTTTEITTNETINEEKEPLLSLIISFCIFSCVMVIRSSVFKIITS